MPVLGIGMPNRYCGPAPKNIKTFMGKFKVRFKVKELEFEMEGERETAPSVTHALEQQFGTLLKPAQVASEATSLNAPPPAVVVEAAPQDNGQGRRKSARGAGRKPAETNQPFDFKHDPSKWGNPTQTWSVGQKVMWLLYVIQQQSGKSGLTAQCIVSTFNKHFREAGALKPKSIYRDLNSQKMKNPPHLGQDTAKARPEWFLAEEGKKQAIELVRSSISPQQQTAT